MDSLALNASADVTNGLQTNHPLSLDQKILSKIKGLCEAVSFRDAFFTAIDKTEQSLAPELGCHYNKNFKRVTLAFGPHSEQKLEGRLLWA